MKQISLPNVIRTIEKRFTNGKRGIYQVSAIAPNRRLVIA
jgi:hypothetical protein